jgi:hypothetical protein
MNYILWFVEEPESKNPNTNLMAVCDSIDQAHTLVNKPGTAGCLEWDGVKTWNGYIGHDQNGVSAWVILEAESGVLIEDFPALDQLFDYEEQQL